MPAQPARRILGYDKGTQMVTVAGRFGGQEVLPLGSLPKSEVIAVAKYLGIRFVGKNPMAMPLMQIHNAIVNDIRVVRFVEKAPEFTPSPTRKPTPTTPKEEPMPQPKPTPTPPSPMGLEEIVRGIATDVVGSALQDFTGGVDADKVGEIVSPIMDGLRHEMTELVKANRPIVNTIVVKDKPPRTLKGTQHFMFPKVLGAVSQGIHLWLVGSAGTGKSTIGEQVAEALAVPFSAVNCTSAMTEGKFTGYNDAMGVFRSTEFRRIFEGGGVFVIDEVDNASPNALGILNSALSNGFMAFADKLVPKHPDFVAIATGNTYGSGATMEYVGRNPIDGATIDRFVQLEIPIDEKVEDAMLASVGLDAIIATKWLTAVRKARANVAESGLKVIVSPRATLNGAKLLRSGAFSMSEVFTATVTKGAKPDQVSKIGAGITL
jgi:hypothetical protein